MTNINLKQGDLTRTGDVDAIVTLINSGGMWFGGVDSAIMSVAGGRYHGQVKQVMLTSGVCDGQVIVTKGVTPHRGSFRDVVFVIDDLESPLDELVYSALIAADKENYRHIALPLMRTGVMLGAVEKSVLEVVQRMRAAIDRFMADRPNSQMDITIVVYDDQRAMDLLGEHMTSFRGE